MSPKRTVARGIIKILGRKQTVRVARLLTMESRLDLPNEYGENGEELVQRVVLEAVAAEGRATTAFDVGANIGNWTVGLLAQAKQLGCSSPMVHAFEPTPATFQLLSNRLGAEPGVRLVTKALSDRTGSAQFYVVGSGPAGGTNSLEALHDQCETHSIELTTAACYCDDAKIDRVDLLKIDAEGHDISVMRGAEALFSAGRVGAVQFEYNQRWIYARSFLRDAFELFGQKGYKIGKITPMGIEWYEAWNSELESFREANYLACRLEWVPRFPAIVWWGA